MAGEGSHWKVRLVLEKPPHRERGNCAVAILTIPIGNPKSRMRYIH
jgi:hypothetical protein